MNPHDTTKQFEAALCEYTGAPFAVAVNSCTMALLLCSALMRSRASSGIVIEIPKRTYVGVAMSIANAGCGITFREDDWQGQYELALYPQSHFSDVQILDAARMFTSGMYREACGNSRATHIFQCVSFHVSKILGHSQGGAILHNDAMADQWFRRARFDGRREGMSPRTDIFDMVGWHCYMSPDVAAALMWKLSVLPRHNAVLPKDPYPDLSLAPIFGGS